MEEKENVQRLFVTEYELNGEKFTGDIWAKTWEQADDFVRQRSTSEKVIGQKDDTIEDNCN